MIKGIWLTLNRFCNFRCSWCYAKNTKYDKRKTMQIDLAKQIISFTKLMGLRYVVLIGGEPTYYPYLFELLEFIKQQDLVATIITNGYRFSNKSFVKEIETLLRGGISFSIQAANKEQQKKLTATDTFNNILKAMCNLQEVNKFEVGYSVVLNSETIDNLEEFAQLVKNNAPGKDLLYILCNPIISKTEGVNCRYMVSRKDLIKKISEKWERISDILGGHVYLEQSLPKCDWPQNFIDTQINKKQFLFCCNIMSREKLIFNTNGELLVCNSLADFPIAKFGETFRDIESFKSFWNSKVVKNLYKKFYEYPQERCIKCDSYDKCGGGCPLKHFENVQS